MPSDKYTSISTEKEKQHSYNMTAVIIVVHEMWMFKSSMFGDCIYLQATSLDIMHYISCKKKKKKLDESNPVFFILRRMKMCGLQTSRIVMNVFRRKGNIYDLKNIFWVDSHPSNYPGLGFFLFSFKQFQFSSLVT